MSVSAVLYDLRGGHPVRTERPIEPIVMCLGNFDGVHRAHASLIRSTVALRDQRLPQGLCGVFTFIRPASDFRREFKPDSGQSIVSLRPVEERLHLTTLEEKLRLFSDLGVDIVCLVDFQEVYSLSPDAFLTFLSKELGVRGAVCGFNFHFGVGGQGTADTLKAYFDRPGEGCFCHVAPPYLLDGDTVSSTRIRRLLLDGHADTALRHLGHPYTLEAEVVSGKQLGRKLGFPTANQYFPPESLIPAHGVYAVICHTPLGIFPGVANVGSHPTVDHEAAVNCETHVIGPSQDLYGYAMRVEFLKRLRDEQCFDSVEALSQAIARDADAAVAYVQAYRDEQFS